MTRTKKIPEGYEVRREWSLTAEGWREKMLTVPIYDEETMKRDVLMLYIMYCALTPLKPLNTYEHRRDQEDCN